jgi:hypothetical protein
MLTISTTGETVELAPNGKPVPPIDRALLATVAYISHAIEREQFEKAFDAFSELGPEQMIAIWIAPTKGGPFPQPVWNSIARGAYRAWAIERGANR